MNIIRQASQNMVLYNLYHKNKIAMNNCIIETFFSKMKMIYTFKVFSEAVDEYLDYYNNKRIPSKTKWMNPVKYRETSICVA